MSFKAIRTIRTATSQAGSNRCGAFTRAGQTFSPKVWNDAYLAAFAKAANFELVTLDRGFAQYQHVRSKILS
jgi:predicted nucleic acid-binding protein